MQTKPFETEAKQRKAKVKKESRKRFKRSINSILRPLYGKKEEKQIVAFDIETNALREAEEDVEIIPYSAGVYDGTAYFDFISELHEGAGGKFSPCLIAALDHLLTPKYANHWIYAHNGGNFDFIFVMRVLLRSPHFRKRFRISVTLAGSSILQIEARRPHKGDATKTARRAKGQLKWTFVDSVKLIQGRLDEIGEAFGLGNKLVPLHTTGKRKGKRITYDELATPKHRAIMREYLERDCRLLHAALEKMQRTVIDLGGTIGVTLPATAMDLFRRKYLGNVEVATNRHYKDCPQWNIDLPSGKTPEELKGLCTGCLHGFIRRAYYGGRTEIFRTVFEPKNGYGIHDHIDVYDINSHYPHCMLEPMPVGFALEFEGMSEAEVYKAARTLIGIVDCDVYIPEDCYLPCLPVPHNGKLVFPSGHFRGTWDTAELTLLQRVGGKIIKTYKACWFETRHIFHDYVTDIYKFRNKEAPTWTRGMDLIAKLLLNSLYGKWAMREFREQVIINPEEKDLEGLTTFGPDLSMNAFTKEVYVSPNYIAPQLSVHVTALARARLWEHLNSVLQAGGYIYYCDTDSIFCSGVTMPTSKLLGGLKHENTVLRARFVAPKLYLIETQAENLKKEKEPTIKVVAKGMGPGIKGDDGEKDPYDRQMSEFEFLQLISGERVIRSRLSKFKESLRDITEKKHIYPRVKPSLKQIRSTYDKRIVLDDFNTRPLILNKTKQDNQQELVACLL